MGLECLMRVGWGIVRHGLLAICMLAALTGGVTQAGAIPDLNDAVTYSVDTERFALSLNSDQSVRGTGFYNTYQNLGTGSLVMANRNYGSGNYIYESNVGACVSFYTDAVAARALTNQKIGMKESTNSTYSEVKFGMKGSTGTISFNIPIFEATALINYDQGTSMDAMFGADSLKKDVNVDLYWDTDSYDTLWDDMYYRSKGLTNLTFTSEIMGGVHIGELTNVLGEKHPITTSLIDEDYVGALNIAKKMSLATSINRTAVHDDWLPCCSGGWRSMDIHDQRGHGASARGIFDCTCYNVPKTAEFQRIY